MYALCNGRVHANTMVGADDMQDSHQALNAIAYDTFLLKCMQLSVEKYDGLGIIINAVPKSKNVAKTLT